MDPSVFKAYDVRGRVDTGELTPELFESIGAGFAVLTGAGEIAVGRDCRESSSSLFEGLAAGITGAGAGVVDLGEVPTDVVYFYSGAQDVPGAIITASHNPPTYNGLKLCRAGAAPVGEETGLREIEQWVGEGKVAASSTTGGRRRVDPVGAYVDHLMGVVSAEAMAALAVAVDGGNGMAGVVLEDVFDRIPPKMTGLYIEPDGTFPNHPADPIQPENLADLIALMSEDPHDLGVAFDGDADRAFFIDDRSRALPGSTVTALIARWMLRRHPGGKIVHNLIVSRCVPEVVREGGGEPIRTRVGHSFIKQVMADTDAIFGGEHSGHYYFKDNFRADSGMLAMLVLLQVISEDGRPLSVIRQDVERYESSGEVNFEVEDPVAVMTAVEGQAGTDAVIDHLDGLTIDYGESWLNIRPSNTEPLLRLNVEARTEAEVDELVGRIREIVEATA
jgi:phosphomannomutase